jgi:proton-dependent oligopeptide transporter, POT family
MLPTIIYLLCPLVLFIGRNMYKSSPPEGSVLAQALRIWRYCAQGQWTWNLGQLWRNLTADDFFEKAKPSKIPTEKRPTWMRFDDQWVDEVKRGFKACQVFVFFPIYCKSKSRCYTTRLAHRL